MSGESVSVGGVCVCVQALDPKQNEIPLLTQDRSKSPQARIDKHEVGSRTHQN